jgi:hypothetical protein
MKAITYLLITQIKNRILSLKKKPALLVFYLVMLVIVGFSVGVMMFANIDKPAASYADERILFAFIAAFGILYIGLFTNTGLSTGSSLFTMADVGLLFVSPVTTKKILMYGLLSTFGKSLLASIFIIFQIGNLKSNFNYGMREIFALFIIYAIMVLFCQLMSIGIYIFTNGNPTRKTLVKTILIVAAGILISAIIIIQRQNQIGLLEATLQVITSDWFGYIPVSGWATMFFIGTVQGSLPTLLIPIFLFIITGAFIVSLLTVGTADYYEDVLLSTEITYQTQKAAKEGGKVPRKTNKRIKVKENEKGIDNGQGAMTLMYKHLVELRRRSRFIFVDGYTIFMGILLGVIGYNFKKYNAPDAVGYVVLGTAIYIQFFMTIMGKLKDELMKPYIYLIPESSLKKVIAASLTSLIKPCIDGILMFGIFFIAGGTDLFNALFIALAYAASGTVFVGLTILYQRLLGGQPNKLVQGFVGIGIIFAIMTPSIGASVAAAILLPEALKFLCTLPYTGFCLLFAIVIYVSCGNLIDKAEYTGKL